LAGIGQAFAAISAARALSALHSFIPFPIVPPAPQTLREQIQAALGAFASQPLFGAARELFRILGYSSDRTLPIGSVDAFCRQFDPTARLEHPSALKAEWKSIHLLFQLTDQELSRQNSLFTDTTVQQGLFHSYIFFAIELNGDNYPRGKLTGLVRQLNRIFPMPVMVLIKHLADRQPVLSIAVINRRRNKLDASRDVLEKATIIRDVSLVSPHRGHLDILDSLALPNLVHPQKKPITDFDTLHAAWEQIFNVELLNERFYRELANWYFWALPQVEFPDDLSPDASFSDEDKRKKNAEKRRATSLIRLLTRLIFCWFLKEKNLIPEKLFHPTDLAKLLNGFDPESETSSTYYQAILQNLFFATLNQRMGKDSSGKPYRVFAKNEGFQKNKATYDINNLYRYESFFSEGPDAALALFADVPFLNGGLFECLDRTDETTEKKRYLDGFSRNPKKRPHVPDRLFFDSGETADLTEAYGDKKRKAEKVTGLIHILNRYKFTIVENTPIDQEIALDPELLGKVFENLLASYNEETKTTARKQTGSFYTPRPIVDYMVDESLKAHLARVLVEKAAMSEPDARAGLDLLFAYTEKEHPFTAAEVAILIAAIDALKILDPACGSGAFPMGVLHKLVYILQKLDPGNERWKETQLAKLDSPAMREELERAFAENNDDYGRKLSLIENCLYGVDIQPIAIQITKLRFFISLVADQKTSRDKAKNLNIKPLPNLETKFVAANTLIGLPISDKDLFIEALIAPIEKEIEDAYHGHFTIQRRDQKLALQKKIKALRLNLAETLAGSLGAVNSAKAKHLAEWDPFDPQSTADFFDPHWMFGRSLKDGFDVVIGNPPYIDSENMTNTNPRLREYIQATYSMTKGNWDIYIAFYEKGFKLLNENGVLTFITPDKWISKPFGDALRLQTTNKIYSILKAGRDVFESVNVDAIVSLFTNRPQEQLRIYDIIESEITHKCSIAKDLLKPPYAYDWLFSDFFDLFSKVEEQRTRLSQIGLCENACATSDAYKLKEFIEEKAETDARVAHLKIINTGTIGKYVSKWGKREMVYLGQRYLQPVVLKARFLANFQNSYGKKSILPKLIVKGLNLLDACLDSEGEIIPGKTTLMVTSESPEGLKFLLGLLNSKLVFFYLKEKYPASSYNLGTTFTKDMINNLPIPALSGKRSGGMIEVIERIIAAKKTNPAADTSALEREIDQQVYALYGLTPEEIAIVEGTAK